MVLESVTSTSLLSNKQQWLWVDPGEAISKLPLGFCTLLGNKLCGPGFVPVALGSFTVACPICCARSRQPKCTLTACLGSLPHSQHWQKGLQSGWRGNGRLDAQDSLHRLKDVPYSVLVLSTRSWSILVRTGDPESHFAQEVETPSLNRQVSASLGSVVASAG